MQDRTAAEPLEALLARLAAGEVGLSSSEAARRRVAGGAAPPRLHRRVWGTLREAVGPLGALLLAAATASAFVGERLNAAIIAVIVASSAALNLVQRGRAERAVRRLQAQVAPTATVLRDGAWRELPRDEVVPGDVIRLGAGDLVPADARLLASRDLHVQQAALTGESFPAEKAADRAGLASVGPGEPSLVFLGSSVVSGTATAIIYAAGRATAFGDIVTSLAARPEETEFERGTRAFGAFIVKVVLALVAFILVSSLALGRNGLESLLFAVALAVGLTPEFLPMILTVTLAAGARRMARDKVIVKHLEAIQNLGSIDVLCSDKTGTLTAGTMSLDRSLDGEGRDDGRALELGRLNSRCQTGMRSPLDAAILEGAPPGDAAVEKTDELPFDFERRRLSVVVGEAGRYRLVTKGAAEGVLAVSTRIELAGEVRPLDEAARARCDELVRELGGQGLRVLAVAWRDVPAPAGCTVADERELTLAGFLTFADHPLEDAAGSLARLAADGVQVKILSGDDERVSQHICRQVGLDGVRVLTGPEIERLDDEALGHAAEETRLFARVAPAQKLRIIKALRRRGHVVGFLGDGINDAPSLHGADVGISVAGAADVAREASDIILLERHLDVLHAGVVAGRASSGNVLKYLLMGTSSAFGNVFSMAAASLFLPFLPMLPTQILLNNFLYDLAQITIPTDRIDAAFVARPRRWDVGLIRRFMLAMGPLSSVYDGLTFLLLLVGFHLGAAQFQTGWFVESLATQTLVLFVIRTPGRPWRSRPSGPVAATALLVVLAGVLLPFSPLARPLGFVPPPARFLFLLLPLVASYLIVVEVVKGRLMRRLLR